jgi:2-polyprenyl-6-methoxyphenol hydroxylase-like FAD-dependent oxidoreductase
MSKYLYVVNTKNRSVADDQQVVAYNENEPSLTLSTGEVHKADIIIAADGKLPFIILLFAPR